MCFLDTSLFLTFILTTNRIYKTNVIERTVVAKSQSNIYYYSHFKNDEYFLYHNHLFDEKKEGILVSDVGIFGIPYNSRWKDEE